MRLGVQDWTVQCSRAQGWTVQGSDEGRLYLREVLARRQRAEDELRTQLAALMSTGGHAHPHMERLRRRVVHDDAVGRLGLTSCTKAIHSADRDARRLVVREPRAQTELDRGLLTRDFFTGVEVARQRHPPCADLIRCQSTLQIVELIPPRRERRRSGHVLHIALARRGGSRARKGIGARQGVKDDTRSWRRRVDEVVLKRLLLNPHGGLDCGALDRCVARNGDSHLVTRCEPEAREVERRLYCHCTAVDGGLSASQPVACMTVVRKPTPRVLALWAWHAAHRQHSA